MKKRKTAVIAVYLLLAGLSAAVWAILPASIAGDEKKADDLIAEASELEAKKIFFDALERYNEAFSIRKKDYGLAVKIAQMHLILGDHTMFLTACDRAIGMQPGSPDAYSMKIDYYVSAGNYAEALRTVRAAEEANAADQSIREVRRELGNKCDEIWVSLSSVGDWHLFRGEYVASAEIDGCWGVVTSNGKKLLKFKFDMTGVPDEDTGLVPVMSDGELFYVDTDGNRRLSPDTGYSYIGPFGNGLAPACKDGVWGYIDRGMNEHRFEFDYAGAFSGGSAAVKKDGKWALISPGFVTLTGFAYDLILIDSNGFATEFGRAIAERGGEFFILGKDGKELSGGYAKAAPASSFDGPIAVMTKDGWGFAGDDGSILLSLSCVEARSFSQGLAAVLTEAGWVYIDTEGRPKKPEKGETEAAPREYGDGCGPFSPDGSAFVWTGYSFNILRLCRFETE